MSYFELTNVADEKKNIVNPASEESIVLLRRIAKILENQQAVDAFQRQRVVIDGAIPTGVNTIGAVSIAAGSTLATVTTVGNLAGQFGWNQQILSDPARTAYNTGIRQQLTFA